MISFCFHHSAIPGEKKRPLSDSRRGCEIARNEIQREARDRSRILRTSIVITETLTFRRTIALQRYVLSHRSWFNPLSRGRVILYHNPPKKVNREFATREQTGEPVVPTDWKQTVPAAWDKRLSLSHSQLLNSVLRPLAVVGDDLELAARNARAAGVAIGPVSSRPMSHPEDADRPTLADGTPHSIPKTAHAVQRTPFSLSSRSPSHSDATERDPTVSTSARPPFVSATAD